MLPTDTETTPDIIPDDVVGEALIPLSPRARLARRRALLALGGMTALLLLLWLGDALSGLVPARPYHATVQSAGAYRITLAVVPTQPTAGAALHAQAHVTDAAGHLLPAAVVTYRWEMVTMDMGTMRGNATTDATLPGTYDATVVPLMGGYWRLTITVHTAQAPDGSTAFDIPVRG